MLHMLAAIAGATAFMQLFLRLQLLMREASCLGIFILICSGVTWLHASMTVGVDNLHVIILQDESIEHLHMYIFHVMTGHGIANYQA